MKTEVGTWLNRTDLTDNIPGFIQNAEAAFKRDHKLRKLQTRTFNATTSNDETLPSDFQSMEFLYHDGSTYYGELDEVNPGFGAEYKSIYHGASSGAPMKYAVLDGKLRFYPTPDATYTLKMGYWRKIVALSDSQATNWLLTDHPDIYLFGALVQAEPFLKNDPRLATWKTMLAEALEQLHQYTDKYHNAGQLVARPQRPLG